MAGHMSNRATKFEDPTTIRSWVTSYNGSHWLPLKMRTRPLRIRRITWPVSRGSKTVTFLECSTPICLSLYNFYWAPTTIKCRLLSSRPMSKPFSGEKNCPVEMGPKNGGLGENGGSNLRYWFRDPQKALPCADPRRLAYFVSKSVLASRR